MKNEHQIRMFGVSTEEAMNGIETLQRFSGSRAFALTSLLSDVQMEIELGHPEAARQLINIVKLGLAGYVDKELDRA